MTHFRRTHPPDPVTPVRDDRELIRVLLDPGLTRAEADRQLGHPADGPRSAANPPYLPLPPEQVRAPRPRTPHAPGSGSRQTPSRN